MNCDVLACRAVIKFQNKQKFFTVCRRLRESLIRIYIYKIFSSGDKAHKELLTGVERTTRPQSSAPPPLVIA